MPTTCTPEQSSLSHPNEPHSVNPLPVYFLQLQHTIGELSRAVATQSRQLEWYFGRFDTLRGISSLNDDCWIDVMKHLDPWDIMSLRQVNKYLSAITNEYAVWLNQANSIENYMVLPYFRREVRSQLEMAVLRAIQLDQLWSSESPHPSRTLRFRKEYRKYLLAYTCSSLVKGSNIFITGDQAGLITFWDLRATPPRSTPLGQLVLYLGGCEFDTELFSDRGEIVVAFNTLPTSSDHNEVYLWTISVEETRLVSSKNLDLGSNGPILSLRLCGDLLLCLLHDRYMVLVDWYQATSGASYFRYSSMLLPFATWTISDRMLRLLPERRILVIWEGSLAIFEFPPFESVSQLEQPLPSVVAEPCWIIGAGDLRNNTVIHPKAQYLTSIGFGRWYVRVFCTERGFEVESMEFEQEICSVDGGRRRCLVVTKPHSGSSAQTRLSHLITHTSTTAGPSGSIIRTLSSPIDLDLGHFRYYFDESLGKICCLSISEVVIHDFLPICNRV